MISADVAKVENKNGEDTKVDNIFTDPAGDGVQIKSKGSVGVPGIGGSASMTQDVTSLSQPNGDGPETENFTTSTEVNTPTGIPFVSTFVKSDTSYGETKTTAGVKLSFSIKFFAGLELVQRFGTVLD